MGRFPTMASAAWLSLVSSVLENTSRNPTTQPAPMTCKAATHHTRLSVRQPTGASEILRDPRTKRNSASKAFKYWRIERGFVWFGRTPLCLSLVASTRFYLRMRSVRHGNWTDMSIQHGLGKPAGRCLRGVKPLSCDV